MKKYIAVLMLGTTLATSTMGGGVALAQSADPFPYCQALSLPPPDPDPTPAAATAAAAPAPVAAATAAAANAAVAPAPAAAATPAATPVAAIAAAATAPAAPPEPPPPPPPTISDLLKSVTDSNKIVDTLLDAYAPLKPADYDQLFRAVVAQVQSTYVDPVKVAAISTLPRKYRGKIKSREELDKALYAMAKALGDPGTTYTSAPDQLSLELRASVLKVAFFGLHLQAKDDGTFQVASIVPGTTAELAGFRIGDTLVSINGKELKGLSKSDAEGLELNPMGNQLQVVSVQDGAQVDRQYMLQAAVPYKPAMQVLPGGVGYVKMPTQVSAQVVGAVVQNLVKMQLTTSGGMAGIVIDLRYVNAASVKAVRGLLPVLISSGVVLHEQVRVDGGAVLQSTTDTVLPMPEYAKSMYTADQLQVIQALKTLPLVILVNGSTTAPGAEQVAVALRDGRPNTTVVGEHLRGNGIESSFMQLPNCGMLTVTTTRYTTAKGDFLGDVGVEPNIVVQRSRNLDDGDVQLAKAVEVVKSKSAYRPANLVQTDVTEIPALGPPPKLVGLAPDIDPMAWVQEYKSWLVKGLVLIALLMLPLLVYLIPRRGRGGRGGGGTSGASGKKPSGMALWRRLRGWRALKGAQSAAQASVISPATTPPDLSQSTIAAAAAVVVVAPVPTLSTAAAKPPREFFWSMRLPKVPKIPKIQRLEPPRSRTTKSENEMTSKAGGFFSHIAVRGTLGAVVLIASLGGLWFYAQTNGGFKGVGSNSSDITYMTQANMKALINLKSQGKGKFTAGVDKAVVVLECPKEACEDADLALAEVAQEFKDTVVVVAIDPYVESKVVASFEKTFVTPGVVQSIVMPMAAGYLQSQKQPVNEQTLQQVMAMPDFQNAVQQRIAAAPLLSSAYPKFFFFAPKDFQLVLAAPGLADKDALEKFVNTGFAQIKAMAEAAAAPPAAATPAAAAAAPAAVVATPAVTPTPAAAAPAAAATPTPVAASAAPATPPPAPVVSGAAPATAVATPAPQAAVKP